jgi:Fe-S-cluster containining protein
MNPAAVRYRTLLQSLDHWTTTAHQLHPGVIPCRQGCTACCHGPFDISVADVLLLRETVAELPQERRAALLARAEAAAARQQGLAPDWPAPFDVRELGEARFDEVCDALATEPCPCLEDGGCVVYEGRPAVCRMMGLGLESPDDRRLANGCPIQSEFPAYAALPAQPFDLPAFEDKEEACLVEAGLALFDTVDAAGYETSIALALSGQ